MIIQTFNNNLNHSLPPVVQKYRSIDQHSEITADYGSFINNYKIVKNIEDEVDAKTIEKLIQEIKKLLPEPYEIEEYDYEKDKEEGEIYLAIKLKNFPEDENNISFSVDIMNQLYELNKLPDNIDIYFV